MEEDIYDITPIPDFPYEPDALFWLSLLAFLILFALITRTLSKKRYHAKFKANPLLLAKAELRKLNSKERLKPIDLAKVSRTLKRLIETQSSLELSTLSPDQLNSLCNEVNDPTLEDLIKILITLDLARYASTFDTEQIRDQLVEITKIIEELDLGDKGV